MTATDLTTAFDWLEFTVKELTLQDLISEILQLKEAEFKALQCGRFGYNTQWKWSEGNVFILFNSGKDQEPILNDTMGIHTIITGTGCRTYEQYRGIRELLLTVIEKVPENSKFTRIDLAIDDHQDKLINYDRIHTAAINGMFTSRWNKWDELNSRSCTNGNFIGRTMYFGSQKSDIFVRIYDKKLERLANRSENAEKLCAWTRLEVVFKKERAQLLAKHLTNGTDIGIVLRSTLNNYIRFLAEPDKPDSNKSRWPTAKWWQELLGDVDKLKLTILPLERTIEQMQDWVDRQIAPTLSTLMMAYDGDLSWVYKTIHHGMNHMKAKHVDAINEFQKIGG